MPRKAGELFKRIVVCLRQFINDRCAEFLRLFQLRPMAGVFEPDQLFAFGRVEPLEITFGQGSRRGDSAVVPPQEKINRQIESRDLFEQIDAIKRFLPETGERKAHS
jgi:glycyl-tRNA synthetase alpha subunit